MTINNLDEINSDFTIGFIGFGLIGGSIAKSLKAKYKNITIIGYQYREMMSEDNKLALEDNILSSVTSSLEDFSVCHMIFLCAPVIKNTDYLPILKSIIKADCIITDVGSVKSNIHKAVIEQELEANFIGGHPMTGSEKSGYKYSSKRLFENTYYIITPTPQTPNHLTNRMIDFVKDIGAIPILLDYVEHDKIVAAISHLPHIIAASLVNLVGGQKDSGELMKILAAGGFRDITRIASSSPTVWENISIANGDFIKELLDEYIKALCNISRSLDNKDSKYIYDTFNSAKNYRNALPKEARGILEKSFEIYVDIDDETGEIASVATLLANNNISIKNIGIIHNREYHDGVLRIEFYEEYPQNNAVLLLKEHAYTVYER